MSDVVKCLIWDLDNTLWQGTLVEDAEVQLAAEMRAVVAELDSRGILQSVCSRNDHDEAWARLEKLGIAEYFVLPQISWGPKSVAVRQIADQLQFAPGTIAFIDDQPAERAEVNHHLPEVRCYPAEVALTLPTLPEFTPPVITEDSRQRRLMYVAGFQRDAERAEFTGPDDDFLRTLGLDLVVSRAGPDALARVAELTERTSQMNATGVHYPEADLLALIDDPDHEVLVVTLADRFGPYGAVGVFLLARHPRVWHLKLLATSCRVVSFGVGAVLLRWLTDAAATADVHLVADFRPTNRNRMMEVAYRFAGFTSAGCGRAAGIEAPEGGMLLHLVPTRQIRPDIMRVRVPDLAAGTGEPVEWGTGGV